MILLSFACKYKQQCNSRIFSLKATPLPVFSAAREGGAQAQASLRLPGVSRALAETFSVIGFPHLPRVCFLLTFNMFNRSLVIVPKIIKPVRSIKMIHTQHIGFFVVALVLLSSF